MAAEGVRHRLDGAVNKESLKRALDISNFDVNAILRGAQLTLVGAHRALQNPEIFTSAHYRQAAAAVVAGIAIRLIIAIPSVGVRVLLWILSFIINMDGMTWDDKIVNGLQFVEDHVIQLPLFLMALMRYITPTLDNLFMDSLRWVDATYTQKHKDDNPSRLRPMYYPALRLYRPADGSTHTKSAAESVSIFVMRSARKAGISLAVFALSYLPVVGRLVLPAASFYTFHKAVGLGPAGIIFGTGLFLPRYYLVVFLQSYFASRNLVRQLLEPYFARIRFSKEERRSWFRSREGILFGFGLGFYTLIRVPLVGVLIYGIAEASAAYLITKITDPPPPPERQEGFAASQQEWRNKHEFLSLPLDKIDSLHGKPRPDRSPEIGAKRAS